MSDRFLSHSQCDSALPTYAQAKTRDLLSRCSEISNNKLQLLFRVQSCSVCSTTSSVCFAIYALSATHWTTHKTAVKVASHFLRLRLSSTALCKHMLVKVCWTCLHAFTRVILNFVVIPGGVRCYDRYSSGSERQTQGFITHHCKCSKFAKQLTGMDKSTILTGTLSTPFFTSHKMLRHKEFQEDP